MKLVKYAARVVVICLVIVLTWGVYQYQSIEKTGSNAQPRRADVMIVLGAGVWENGPSPAMQARVEQALEVYQQGYSDRFIVTGGLGTYPPTEAEAMRDILLENGVAADNIHLEPYAVNTFENLQFSKAMMDELKFSTAIIVTDAFHTKRALQIADDLNIEATAAPAVNSVLNTNKSLKRKYTLREILALGKYYAERTVFRLRS